MGFFLIPAPQSPVSASYWPNPAGMDLWRWASYFTSLRFDFLVPAVVTQEVLVKNKGDLESAQYISWHIMDIWYTIELWKEIFATSAIGFHTGVSFLFFVLLSSRESLAEVVAFVFSQLFLSKVCLWCMERVGKMSENRHLSRVENFFLVDSTPC